MAEPAPPPPPQPPPPAQPAPAEGERDAAVSSSDSTDEVVPAAATTNDLLGESPPPNVTSSSGAREPPPESDDLLLFDADADDQGLRPAGYPSDALDVGGAASAGAAAESPVAERMLASPGAQVFDLGGAESPVRGNSLDEMPEEDCTGASGGVNAEDWYALDDEQANKSLENVDGHSEPGSTAGSKPQAAGWASKLGKKALRIGTAAKTGILQEAKLVAADAKDLALGVREGAQITMQDTKVLSRQFQADANKFSKDAKSMVAASSWRGLWRGNNKSGDGEPTMEEPITSTPAAGSRQAPSADAIAETATDASVQPDLEESQLTETASPPAAAVASAVSETPATPGDATLASAPSPDGAPERSNTSDRGHEVSHTIGRGLGEPTRGFQALKQNWKATTEVSSQMWKDIKEAKDEAMSDFRFGVNEIKQGVQKLRPVGSPSEGPADESSTEVEPSPTPPPESEADTVPEADMASTATVQAPAASPFEALDSLVASCLDMEVGPRDGTHDDRTAAERKYDEQSARVAQKMEESARKTAAAAANVWRKTELSIKKGLALPLERSNSSGSVTATAAEASAAAVSRRADVEEERQSTLLLSALPSTRANYVDLVVRAAEAAPSPPTDVAATQPTLEEKAAKPPADAAAPPSLEDNSKKTSSSAANRARKFGGKLAKQSKKVSGSLLKQARDLGQNVQAGAVRQTSRTFVGASTTAADAGDEEEGIFEIGSDDEEDLFGGEDNSGTGSDMVSVDAEDRPSCSSSAAQTPRAQEITPPQLAPSTAVSATAQSEDPLASVAVDEAAVVQREDLFADLVSCSAGVPASGLAVAASTIAQTEDPFEGLQQASSAVGSSAAPAVDPTPAPSAGVATGDDDDDDWFGDMLGDDLAVAPTSIPVPPATAAAPSSSADAAKTQMQLKMEQRRALIETPGESAPAPTSAPTAPVAPVATASADSGEKLDFLSAAEKELEDLFGDSD